MLVTTDEHVDTNGQFLGNSTKYFRIEFIFSGPPEIFNSLNIMSFIRIFFSYLNLNHNIDKDFFIPSLYKLHQIQFYILLSSQ